MIDAKCECGATFEVPESMVGKAAACGACGADLYFVAAEPLGEGAGFGDFDGKLVVVAGPDRVGDQVLLGGVVEISIGKSADRHVRLGAGTMVSRAHAKLLRLDFGPSRWHVEDTNSTNGLFVNGQRVTEHELRPGDVIRVGDYELKYVSTFALPAPPPPVAAYAGGPVCPSCRRSMAPNCKICVDCGIDVKTGRALVVSKGLDEDDLAIRADTWIRIASWIIPFGLFPIASEAFGTRKPLTTWAITIITVLASTLFMIAVMATDDEEPVGLMNLMQWSGSREVSDRKIERVRQRLEERAKSPRGKDQPARTEMSKEEVREMLAAISSERPPEGVGFRWWQPVTHALLHDPSHPILCFFHLAGNLLFLWVFGMRVNEMIGNAKFAVVYPLLAIGSTVIDMIVHMDQPLQASVGASGAIMGLAGMYFVFFPAQRVHMAIWFRAGVLTGWRCFYKLFTMRGFWLLILWIVWNDVVPMFFNWSDGVGHWAHVGGFVTGVAVALLLLVTRQADARRGDLLSVVLGRRAWALLGRPGGTSAPGMAAQ